MKESVHSIDCLRESLRVKIQQELQAQNDEIDQTLQTFINHELKSAIIEMLRGGKKSFSIECPIYRRRCSEAQIDHIMDKISQAFPDLNWKMGLRLFHDFKVIGKLRH